MRLAIFDTPTGGRVGGWPGGWPVGSCDYIANSAQLKLEIGLSLAICHIMTITYDIYVKNNIGQYAWPFRVQGCHSLTTIGSITPITNKTKTITDCWGGIRVHKFANLGQHSSPILGRTYMGMLFLLSAQYVNLWIYSMLHDFSSSLIKKNQT